MSTPASVAPSSYAWIMVPLSPSLSSRPAMAREPTGLRPHDADGLFGRHPGRDEILDGAPGVEHRDGDAVCHRPTAYAARLDCTSGIGSLPGAAVGQPPSLRRPSEGTQTVLPSARSSTRTATP